MTTVLETTPTPTPTVTAAQCSPSPSWLLHAVVPGAHHPLCNEDLLVDFSLGAAFAGEIVGGVHCLDCVDELGMVNVSIAAPPKQMEGLLQQALALLPKE